MKPHPTFNTMRQINPINPTMQHHFKVRQHVRQPFGENFLKYFFIGQSDRKNAHCSGTDRCNFSARDSNTQTIVWNMFGQDGGCANSWRQMTQRVLQGPRPQLNRTHGLIAHPIPLHLDSSFDLPPTTFGVPSARTALDHSNHIRPFEQLEVQSQRRNR